MKMTISLPDPKLTLLNGLVHIRYNLAITLVCIVLITAMDMVYHFAVNEHYVFGVSGLLTGSYAFVCLIVFAGSFLNRGLYTAFFTIILLISVSQIINFEYFGSYILPINFIQLAPDFMLIMASLFEVLGEMVPVLVMAGLASALILLFLVPFSRHRMIDSRSALFIAILLCFDFLGNYLFIEKNRAKLGEPAFKSLFPDVNRLGLDNAYRSFRYLSVGIMPDRMAGRTTDYPALPEPEIISAPDANIVLILGETVRAQSLSLLGYERETTPLLAQVEGLYATSIFSAGTMTRTSVAGLINRMKYPGIGEQFLSQSNCLFRLAKKNGFKTHFIYGYNRNAADTLLPFMCSKSLDSVRVNTDAPQALRYYDASLPYHLDNIDLDQRNFIVIGPRGAHSPYGNKSPKEFKRFDDDYDNAIYYSDFVAAGLIEKLREKSTKPTYIIYTADHGELLRGEGSERGHGWFRNQVFRVPFLFLQLDDTAPADLMSEVGKVQSHFDVASLILRLMGYDVAIEDPDNKEIYINGSDLSGLAGQLRLRFQDGGLQSVELINGTGSAPTLEEVRGNSSTVPDFGLANSDLNY